MGNSKKEPVDQQTVEDLIRALIQFRRKEIDLSSHSVFCKRKSEARILRLLYEHATSEGMKVSELSVHMRVTSPFVTQQLTSLEENRLIYRQTDQNDRRIVRVFLTEEGKQAAIEIKNTAQRWFSGLAEHLGEENSKQLTKLLQSVSQYMNTTKKLSILWALLKGASFYGYY